MAILLQHGPPSPYSGEGSTSTPFERVILVLPTKRRIRQLTRDVVRNAGAVPALPFHTLESLARSVHAAIPGTRRIMAGSVQRLLFSAGVKDVSADLRYFRVRGKEKQLFRGTFDRIVDVITNLKESGVYPQVLREEAMTGSTEEQLKLLDIAAIYEAYERRLEALAADDVPGIYRALSLGCPQPAFAKAFRTLFPAVVSVSLAGFDEFTVPELGFITRICSVGGLSVSLVFDFLPGNKGLFGHLEENYATFRQLGFSAVRTLPEREDVAFGISPVRHNEHVRSAVQLLASALFNADLVRTQGDLSQHVTLVRAKTRLHEVEVICKLVKRLLHERDRLEPGSICVAMVRPQPYTDLMREMFPKFGIPVNITDRFELARSPVVTALLGVLQIPINGYHRDDILKSAQSPYCTLHEGGKPVDPANLERVSRELRIVGGYRNWIDRIHRRSAQAAARLEAGGPAKDELKKELRLLDAAARDLSAIQLLLLDIARDLTPEEFRGEFLNLMRRLAVDANLMRRGLARGADLMERDVRAYARLRDVVDEMTRLLQFQEAAPVRHGLRFYVEQLKTAITGERYNLREQVGRGVLVTSIEETRGLPVDVMIVAGLVDGEFPSVYQPEVFFSTRRQELRERRHSWQNRYLFYQAVTNWSSHLYLTYPERDEELDLVRSPFVEDLLKVARVEEFKSPESIPWLPDLSSEEEFLRWFGRKSASETLPPGAVPAAMQTEVDDVRGAIEVERSRLEKHALPQYEGMIYDSVSGRSRKRLDEMRARAYSASQLETYGRCPFRFFAQRLLRLEPLDLFDEDLTPLERGSILHEALFEFFLARRESHRPPLAGCSDDEYASAVSDLTRILDAKLSEVDIPDAFWQVERELMIGRPGAAEGLVHAFLTAERERTVDTTPSYFEVSFGLAPGSAGRADPLLSTPDPLQIGDVLLAGKVDRVETGDGFFAIVDYKTGSHTPTIRDIRDGLSLQLPLYMLAVERLLEKAGKGGQFPAGGLYYMLGESVVRRLGLGTREYNAHAFDAHARSGQLLASRSDLRMELNAVLTRAGDSVAGIARGRFPLTSPDLIEKVCVYCEYRTMCRIQNFRHVQPQPKEDT